MDFGGLDSSGVLILRVRIIISTGNFPEMLSQRISAGIISVGRLDSLRGSSVKIGAIQRRLARFLRKDDTHKSRSVNNIMMRLAKVLSVLSQRRCRGARIRLASGVTALLQDASCHVPRSCCVRLLGSLGCVCVYSIV